MGHQCSRVYDIDTLQVADHICVWDKSLRALRYQHHGIVREAGTCLDTIRVAHIWSPIENNRKAAQDDSRWRVTTLREFLFNRPISDLRVVQYYTSFLGDLQMKWGEAHMSACDVAPIVITRVDWLMGQGMGKFNILFQNCEHAAYWCKTGKQWCKQALTPRRKKVPFPVTISAEQELLKEIQQARLQYMKQQDFECPDYGDRSVSLKIGQRFVYMKPNKQAFAYTLGELHEKKIQPSRFFIQQKRVAYNVVHLSFRSVDTGRYLYAPPLWLVERGLSLRYKRRGRGLGARNGHRFVRHGTGEMQTLHHDRNWLSVDAAHHLVLCANRRDALPLSFVLDEKERTKSCVSTEFETSSNEEGFYD